MDFILKFEQDKNRNLQGEFGQCHVPNNFKTYKDRTLYSNDLTFRVYSNDKPPTEPSCYYRLYVYDITTGVQVDYSPSYYTNYNLDFDGNYMLDIRLPSTNFVGILQSFIRSGSTAVSLEFVGSGLKNQITTIRQRQSQTVGDIRISDTKICTGDNYQSTFEIDFQLISIYGQQLTPGFYTMNIIDETTEQAVNPLLGTDTLRIFNEIQYVVQIARRCPCTVSKIIVGQGTDIVYLDFLLDADKTEYKINESLQLTNVDGDSFLIYFYMNSCAQPYYIINIKNIDCKISNQITTQSSSGTININYEGVIEEGLHYLFKIASKVLYKSIAPFTIYYDHSCNFCDQNIENYKLKKMYEEIDSSHYVIDQTAKSITFNYDSSNDLFAYETTSINMLFQSECEFGQYILEYDSTMQQIQTELVTESVQPDISSYLAFPTLDNESRIVKFTTNTCTSDSYTTIILKTIDCTKHVTISPTEQQVQSQIKEAGWDYYFSQNFIIGLSECQGSFSYSYYNDGVYKSQQLSGSFQFLEDSKTLRYVKHSTPSFSGIHDIYIYISSLPRESNRLLIRVEQYNYVQKITGANQDVVTFTYPNQHSCTECESQPLTYLLKDVTDTANILIINNSNSSIYLDKNNYINVKFEYQNVLFIYSDYQPYCEPQTLIAYQDGNQIVEGDVNEMTNKHIKYALTFSNQDLNQSIISFKSNTCDHPYINFTIISIDCELGRRVIVPITQPKIIHLLNQDKQTFTLNPFTVSQPEFQTCVSGAYSFNLEKYNYDLKIFEVVPMNQVIEIINKNSTILVQLHRTSHCNYHAMGLYFFKVYLQSQPELVFTWQIDLEGTPPCDQLFTKQEDSIVTNSKMLQHEYIFKEYQEFLSCKTFVHQYELIENVYPQNTVNPKFMLVASEYNKILIYPQAEGFPYDKWITIRVVSNDRFKTFMLLDIHVQLIKTQDQIQDEYYQQQILVNEEVKYDSKQLSLDEQFQEVKEFEPNLLTQNYRIYIFVQFNNTERVSYNVQDRISIRFLNSLFFISSDLKSIVGPESFIQKLAPPQIGLKPRRYNLCFE
eukprot:403341235